MSNDGLRDKTFEFKKRIADNIAAEESEIVDIKEEIETNTAIDINEKEKKYEQIDKLEKLSYDLYYIKHSSISLDAFIVIQTIKTTLFGGGGR